MYIHIYKSALKYISNQLKWAYQYYHAGRTRGSKDIVKLLIQSCFAGWGWGGGGGGGDTRDYYLYIMTHVLGHCSLAHTKKNIVTTCVLEIPYHVILTAGVIKAC